MNDATHQPVPQALDARLQRVGASLLDASTHRTVRPAMTTPNRRGPRMKRGIVGVVVLALGGATIGARTFTAKPKTDDPIVGLVRKSFRADDANSIQSNTRVWDAFTLVRVGDTDVLVEQVRSPRPANRPALFSVGGTPVVDLSVSPIKRAPVALTWWRGDGVTGSLFTVWPDSPLPRAKDLVEPIVRATRTGTVQATAEVAVVGSWRPNEPRFFWIGTLGGGGFPSESFDAPAQLRERAIKVFRGASSNYAFQDGFAYQPGLAGGGVRAIRASEARTLAKRYDRQLASELSKADARQKTGRWSELARGLQVVADDQNVCVRSGKAISCDRVGLFSRLVGDQWVVARCGPLSGGANTDAITTVNTSGLSLSAPASTGTSIVAMNDVQKPCSFVTTPTEEKTFIVGTATALSRPLW